MIQRLREEVKCKYVDGRIYDGRDTRVQDSEEQQPIVVVLTVTVFEIN